MIDYAKLIKEYRDIKCMTQQEFAQVINVGFATVSRWEQGHYVPNNKYKKILRSIFLEEGLIQVKGSKSNGQI